jgi:plasminogen activator inhibitor 1 RNA-binding protein
LQVAAPNAPRKPNEGSTQKFPEGKPITRDEEDAYIAGTSGKKQRERERKTKEFVELDDAKLHREAPRESTRGRGRGRGDFRGEGRGRGEFRGGRGRGEGRGRGGEGRGRGGRGGQATVNVADPSAFPSLGS